MRKENRKGMVASKNTVNYIISLTLPYLVGSFIAGDFGYMYNDIPNGVENDCLQRLLTAVVTTIIVAYIRIEKENPFTY